MALAHYYMIRFAALFEQDEVGIPKASLNSSTTENVLKLVFGIAGGIAVIMIVLGGFKYITSLGNAQNVAKAKDTILYAVIGLIVCILAYAIVGFVITGVSQ
ncbi:hypothetical protein E6Q11_04210 [Candidatus Dojkabacteria bacterium]|uniref:Uncharacterized protein n=1 Tax=Candidatus Dojkabacteria bacterium TaxID=2099670 RepID=A0A5C7J5I0_9BACT|nr:MAG: hypothetical protein E6Q11_04210 [Candidatus Dojkabacteria bacterium]